MNAVVETNSQISNDNQYLSFMIDKSYLSEYIYNETSLNEGLRVEDKLETISKEDEIIVIKYLLDILKGRDIITEEEFNAVLYKYG